MMQKKEGRIAEAFFLRGQRGGDLILGGMIGFG